MNKKSRYVSLCLALTVVAAAQVQSQEKKKKLEDEHRTVAQVLDLSLIHI